MTDRGIAGRRIALVLATSTGGVGQHVRSLAARLGEQGARVRVCGPAATQRLFDFTSAGAAFVPVEIASGLRPVADTRAAVALREATAAAEIVHAHGMRAGLVGAMARPRRTVPVVVTWHNVVLGHTGAKRAVLGQLERVIARRADITLCVSPDLAARVHLLGGRDVRLAPVAPPSGGAAARSPEQVRAELDAGQRPLILTVARLHPQKGLDVLVRAAQALADRTDRPLFVVAGDGPQRAELERMIATTGAPVHLLGHRADIPDLLAAADVVAFPSRWEGSSLAQQETLRAGRPFVGTAVGGVPALVGDAGLLVAPDDPDALAAALCRVLDEPDLAGDLTSRGLARASSWPTEEQVAEQVSAVYAELLGCPN